MDEWEWPPALSVLWAKSDSAGRWHSLVGHLLDTAVVMELIWDEFLTAAARRSIDAVTGGCGRDVLRLLAGWHDLGKATPDFQRKVPELCAGLAAHGLALPLFASRPPLRHGASGAVLARAFLAERGATATDWLIPVISGHHGSFLSAGRDPYRSEHQCGPNGSVAAWAAAQRAVAERLLAELDVKPEAWSLTAPPLALQLSIAGLVSMADWIASSELFPGLGEDRVSVERARRRAREAWDRLGLGTSRRPRREPHEFEDRFGFSPTPMQREMARLARCMTSPGLIVLEAPMGAGKTEAAFAVVEEIDARHGYHGFVFAMPTQGTTDAMFERATAWSKSVDPDFPVALMHGKAMANEHWRSLVESVRLVDVCDFSDELGEDAYGLLPSDHPDSRAGVPSEWLLGRHRGLLSPGVLCTIDQALVAATQVKYVALRFAGLLGKVVVIDEVHSYDVFMGEYLKQFLRWCGDGGIPVIMMSATLAPSQRVELVNAYACGLDRPPIQVPAANGYPAITSWSPTDGVNVQAVDHHGVAVEVSVEVVSESDLEDSAGVIDRAKSEIAEGGVVLVILNTVRRAQEVYQALAERGLPVELLHGRLTTSARAERVRGLVHRLGREGRRPDRLIVVATQIAEQSFDVDADVLITDIAPMDLLLQRLGRLHRHQRTPAQRPGHAEPRVVVMGMRWKSDGVPRFARSFEHVYDRYTLLRTAQQLLTGPSTWRLPDSIPHLVATAYDHDATWPPGWASEGDASWLELKASQAQRAANAQLGVLAAPVTQTLDRLHARTGVSNHVTVRDGEPTVEVALIQRGADGSFATLAGRPLGANGERVSNDAIAREILGDTVRVRATDELAQLAPLPCWAGTALLRDVPAVVLDPSGRTEDFTWGHATYKESLGLVIERRRRR